MKREKTINTLILKCLLFLIFFFFIINYPFYLSGQDCTIISKANNIVPDGLCAPVTVIWEVIYRGVNDGGESVEVQFDWDDGNPVELVTAINTDPSPAVREWTATITHVYPADGDLCNYNPSATLVVDGVVCTSTVQEQNVTVWDTDDENGGEMAIDPEIFYICVGNDGSVIFTDVSQWNCEPPDENDFPNTPHRWIQWIYGTNYTINNIEVNGVVETYPFAGPIEQTFEPIFGPSVPWNTSENIYCPNTALVGQFWEITLRNWNYCNPYDDPLIPGPPADAENGDYPPVITTAMILIVDTPDATITPAGPFCQFDPPVNLNGATPGGIWSGPGITDPNNGTFDPQMAGPGTHTITYIVIDAYGCEGMDTVDIVVYANPVPDILPGPNAEVCPGDNLALDGNPTQGTGTIVSHLWTGDTGPLDNVNIQNPVFNTTTQGVYDLTYTVTDDNGCESSDNITVYVNPVSANIIPDPANVCAGEDLNLNGNPSGGTGNYITHFWTGDTGPLNDVNIQTPVFNTTVTGAYDLTYYVTDDNGCTDSDDITVNVYENPVTDAGPDDSICGLSYFLDAFPSFGIGSWTQTAGPGTANFTNENIPNTFVSVDEYGSYEFTWTEVYGPGCTDAGEVTIVFIEIPDSYAGQDDDTCGNTYFINALPSVGAGIWTQTGGPGTATITSPNSTNTEVSINIYGTYEFTWSEDNSFGCTDHDEVLIGFHLIPTAEFYPADSNSCSPFYINFQNNSVGGTYYYWDFDDGEFSTNEDPSHIFLNDSHSDSVYNVNLVVESDFGCVDSIMHNVTVNPIPVSAFSSDAVPECSPVTVNFTNMSEGSILHIWDYGDSTTIDTADNPTHTFINDTTFIQYYYVQLISISQNGCPDTSGQYVTVYPDPDYDFVVIPDSACHPATVQLLADAGGYNYYWEYGDGSFEDNGASVFHTYTNLTDNDITYTINLITTSVFSCVDTTSGVVTVHPGPAAAFSTDMNSGCSPFVVTFTNLSQGEDYSYWNFGDGTYDTTSLASITHTYINNFSNQVTYTMQLIVETENGCKDSISGNINVYPEVISLFTADSIGCSPLPVQFINQSVGGVSYNWDFGDGGIASYINPNHIFVNTGSSTVVYTVSLITTSAFGCVDTSELDITVFPKPEALFTTDSSTGCSPFEVNITNLSTGADEYLWTFGDGDTSTSSEINIDHIYTNNQGTPSTHILQLVVANMQGCTDTVMEIITVYPDVNALFVSGTAGCTPLTIDFVNQSSGAVLYNWDFGDGATSTGTAPSHTYSNTTEEPEVHTVVLIATSAYGCMDTFDLDITVWPTPLASFNITLSEGCSPLEVIIINNSQGATEYFWNFGDGEISDSAGSIFYHTYINTISTVNYYNIDLLVHNEYGCPDLYSQTITVYPEVYAGFIADTAGCHPLSVSFTNQSWGAQNYLWDFGDGDASVLSDPTHIFTNETTEDITYIVTLTATSQYGCTDEAESSVTVYPSPLAGFTVTPLYQVYPATTVNIQNLTSNGNWNYLWDFGDNNTSVEEYPLFHSYDTWGEYNILLIVSNEFCTDSALHSITIIPAVPVAGFDSSAQGCVPVTVEFINNSQNATMYNWDFGDGYTSSANEPTHTYYEPGIFIVTLTAIGPGGQDTYNDVIITVYEAAEAYFMVEPSVVYLPGQPVHCYNMSVNASTYLWDFGDGNTSDMENPTHIYTEEGIYDITLEVWSEDSCYDVYTLSPAVTAETSGEIEFPNAFTPNTDGPGGSDYSSGGYEVLSHDIFYPKFEGVVEYHLEIFNRWGELIFETDDISIGWNGYYKSRICKQDVYVWKATGKFSNGNSFIKAGDVTLIR